MALPHILAGLLLPRDRSKTLRALVGAEPLVQAKAAEVQRLQLFLPEAAWDGKKAQGSYRLEGLCPIVLERQNTLHHHERLVPALRQVAHAGVAGVCLLLLCSFFSYFFSKVVKRSPATHAPTTLRTIRSRPVPELAAWCPGSKTRWARPSCSGHDKGRLALGAEPFSVDNCLSLTCAIGRAICARCFPNADTIVVSAWTIIQFEKHFV